MSFQPLSDLFTDRIGLAGDTDIQFCIESFLRPLIGRETFYCSVQGMGNSVKIRVHNPALAQQILLFEHDIHAVIKKELNCDIGTIRVMLE